ncbi:MAG: hypothetical protein JSW71_09575 [Gemmatimonadota bacterium]|nr:MAG: hypothetical protein JSW71_09575 [Gemmatimonadota bacterium]
MGRRAEAQEAHAGRGVRAPKPSDTEEPALLLVVPAVGGTILAAVLFAMWHIQWFSSNPRSILGRIVTSMTIVLVPCLVLCYVYEKPALQYISRAVLPSRPALQQVLDLTSRAATI